MTYYVIESGEKYLGTYTDENKALEIAKDLSIKLETYVSVRKTTSEYIAVFPNYSEEY